MKNNPVLAAICNDTIFVPSYKQASDTMEMAEELVTWLHQSENEDYLRYKLRTINAALIESLFPLAEKADEFQQYWDSWEEEEYEEAVFQAAMGNDTHSAIDLYDEEDLIDLIDEDKIVKTETKAEELSVETLLENTDYYMDDACITDLIEELIEEGEIRNDS